MKVSDSSISFYQGLYYRILETINSTKLLITRLERDESDSIIGLDLESLTGQLDELKTYLKMYDSAGDILTTEIIYSIKRIVRSIANTGISSKDSSNSVATLQALLGNLNNFLTYTKSKTLDFALEQDKTNIQQKSGSESIEFLEGEIVKIIEELKNSAIDIEDKNSFDHLVTITKDLELMYDKSEKYNKLLDVYNKIMNLLPSLIQKTSNKSLKSSVSGYLQYLTEKSQLYLVLNKRENLNELLKDGDALLSSSKYDEAIKLFDIVIGSGNEIKDYNGIIKALYSKASALIDLGRFEEAESIYRDLIVRDKTGASWFSLGYVLGEMGRYRESSECYERYLKYFDDPSALGNMGWNYERQRNYPQALFFYDKALKIDRTDVMILSNKADLLQKMGRNNDALECYNEALKLEPLDITLLTGRIIMIEALGNKESTTTASLETIQIFDKILENDPKNLSAMISKGIALDILDEKDEAIEWYDKALEIDPNNPNALYNKSCTRCLQKKYSESLDLLEQAIKLAPSYKETARYDKDFETLFSDERFQRLTHPSD